MTLSQEKEQTTKTVKYKIASLTTIAGSTKAFHKGQFEALSRVGIHTTVICADDPDLPQVLPKDIRFIPVGFTRVLSPLKDLKVLCELYKIFRKEKFNFVQYATPKASLIGSIAAFFARVPIRIYLLWGLYYQRQVGIRKNILKLFEWIICLLSTHVLPNSHEMAKTIVQQKITSESKVEVLLYGSACGIDCEEFDPEKWRHHRKNVRDALGINTDNVLIGIFGRLTGDKGMNEMIDAFQQLAQQMKNVYLLVIGKLEEKDKPLPKTMEQIKNHPQIMSLPYQKTLLPYYTAIDIICLPTYREGFPQAQLEAQAMEVPVITTNISGAREAVANNKTGFLVEPRNSSALIEPLKKLILDEQLRRKMGQEGRKRILRMFDQKDMIQAVVQHRMKLLSGS